MTPADIRALLDAAPSVGHRLDIEPDANLKPGCRCGMCWVDTGALMVSRNDDEPMTEGDAALLAAAPELARLALLWAGERDEARRTLARIVEKIGPDYVSMEGGPPMAVDLDVMEAVSGLIEQANAQADEASRARGEAARLREEVARLRAVVRG